MWTRLTLILAVWLSNSSWTASANKTKIFKFCVVDGVHNSKSIQQTCDEFTKDRAHVDCLIVNDRINCLRRVSSGDADFAILEPEDLIAYNSAYYESRILITHELRFGLKNIVAEDAEFKMVAVVSKNIQRSRDWEGIKFCHSGLDSASSKWTPIFASFLQHWTIPPECQDNMTLLENEISTWSDHFESACIPGPWSYDAKVDSQLKARYRNLCALCDNPNGCYADDKYHGPEGALLCLTDGIGDIAWAKFEDVQRHFQGLNIDNSSYSYFCPNGRIKPIRNNPPCIWIAKPWPVVAAQSQSAEAVAQLIETVSTRSLPWHTKLLELMEAYHVNPAPTGTLMPPGDFLNQYIGFEEAYDRWSCGWRRIKWCVASNLENQKCLWLRNSAAGYGIQPAMSCHLCASRSKCLQAVVKGDCDLFIGQPEEILAAGKQGLTSLLEVMPQKNDDLYKIIALVRSNSVLVDLSDLKGKRACFTSADSIAWYAFMAIQKDLTKNPAWSCPSMMHSFFSEIIFAESQSEMNKSAELAANTYDCLISGRGDVAFVNHDFKDHSQDLRRICVTNDQEKDCFLTWTALNSVIAREDIPTVRRDELQTMLLQLNAWFGSKFINQNPAIQLYGLYDDKEGVIFHKKARSLQEDTSHVRLPRNFKNILKQLENSSVKCNNANQQGLNIFIAIFIISLGQILL